LKPSPALDTGTPVLSQEESGVSQRGIWTGSPRAGSCWQPGCHELGLAGSEEQERAVLYIPLQTHKQAWVPELFHRGWQRTPVFSAKKLSELSSPAFPAPSSAAVSLTFMEQKEKRKEHRSGWCEGHHPRVGRAGS